MARERDIRNAIHDLLVASNAFSNVWITGLPEDYGFGASDLAAASIEPNRTQLTTGWDAQTFGGLDWTGTCRVTLLARKEDAQLRDEWAEQLLDTLHNSINGQSLAGITLPGKTYVQEWTWLPPTAPERRIRATVTYSFIVDGWESFDTSD